MNVPTSLPDRLWAMILNPLWVPGTIERIQAHCDQFPQAPFAMRQDAIARILGEGVSPDDLAALNATSAYEAVLGTLRAICVPGPDDSELSVSDGRLVTPPASQRRETRATPLSIHAAPAPTASRSFNET